MKEPREPIIGAVKRAADEGGDVGGAQKRRRAELADDLHVVVGEAKGRRLRRTGNRGRRLRSAMVATSMPSLYPPVGAAGR